LRALGLSTRKAVIFVWLESAVVAALGLCVTFAPPQLTVAVACAGGALLLLIMVYGVRWLEYHEFLEAGASFTSAARQARWVIRDKINARDTASLIRKAESFEQLAGIVEESASLFSFAHMEIGHGALARHLPPHIAGELHTARFCRLEYPIAMRATKPNEAVTLNIWCTTESRRRPVGAERVARIIGPAISGWLDVGRLPLPASTSAPVVAAVTATASTGVAAVPIVQPMPQPERERERPRRGARPAHAGDERVTSIGMAAKSTSRSDEMRS
jgi:hypothetical protein